MTETITQTTRDATQRPPMRSSSAPAYFAVMPSPIGDLRITMTDRGVAAVEFVSDDRGDDFAGLLLDTDLVESPEKLTPVFAAFDSYFNGEKQTLDLPLDLTLVRNVFARSVLARLIEVGYGSTITYGELAAVSGAPRAARAVGTVCARNPLPILIPCHRVVPTHGIGNYGGGVEAKQWLLELEGAKVGAKLLVAA
jgi:methylated-DNA-[protein]-cysteine S-methyltransferase